MRKVIVAVLSIAFLLLSTPVWAITNGQPDGNKHPEVGALVGTFSSGTFPYCSGTLISPTVFLTAAHCNIGTSTVNVTFDSQYSPKSKLYTGTYIANPNYNQSQNDPQDIAVVIFKNAIPNLTPAKLPTLGQLDNVAKDQQFTAVGYGGTRPTGQTGGQNFTYPDIREYAASTFNSIGPGYLRLSQNASTDNGGTCYGDSGGPNFLGAGASETTVIAATTITGDTPCKSTNVDYRLDTQSARAFLGQYVALP